MSYLFVIDCLGSGGAQRQMVTLAINLKQRGYDIDFFVYYPQFEHFLPIIRNAGIKVHCVSKKGKNPLMVIERLRELIASRKYRLILSFLDGPNLYTELARIGYSDTKLIVSERFMYPSGKLPLTYRSTQICHRLADFITVNSHHQRIRMEHEFPWMKNQITTIYNGVDLGIFYPRDKGLHHYQGNEIRFITISSLQEKKNAVGLIEAMAHLRTNYGWCPYIDWAGQKVDSPSGIKHLEHLESLLEKYDLHRYWTWLGERNDIHDILPTYDALLHPSYFEGLPNAVCEGLAAGLPILASNTGDHDRLVTPGINGYLFDPEDPENIADILLGFSKLSITERQAMSIESRNYAEENLSVERFVEQYHSLFQSILAES